MKNYFILASAALALASCSNDEFLGEGPGTGNKENTSNAILFSAGKNALTRGDIYGSEAATILGNNFIVEGTKGALPATTTTTTTVFDNYLVTFEANTAGTTESNTNNWEYVGVNSSDQVDDVNALLGRTVDQQTIKYWDFSAPQYDFVAYSTGNKKMVNTTPSAGQVQVTKIDGTAKSYSFTGLSAEDLSSVYVTDVVTVEKASYGQPVVLPFKNLTAKVRMAIYETVPGYSVKDVEFYADNTLHTDNIWTDITSTLTDGDDVSAYYTESGGAYTAATGTYDSADGKTYYSLSHPADPAAVGNATLFTPKDNPLPTSGTIAVTYPHVGTDYRDVTPAEDYNRAQVAVTAGGSTSTTQAFGTLNAGTMLAKEHKEEEGSAKQYIGRTSTKPTFAGNLDDNYYQAVIPNTAGQTLTLRVNYTLVSTDGSKEEIKVWGAKAIVPATYTKWQSNYAYTYIFKISDKSNGSTEELGGKEYLFPITFDAVVAQVTDANAEQTTITTVATPSITTYQKDHNYEDADSYMASKGAIYVMVKKDGGALAQDLNTQGQLYKVTTTGAEISEATVTDAMLKTVSGSADVDGRNGLALTEVATTVGNTYINVEGNEETVTGKSNCVAKWVSPAAGTYAYVYTAKDPTVAGTFNVYQPKPVTVGSTTVDGLKSIAWSTLASTADMGSNEVADQDYLYFQVTKNGAGTEVYYSYITVVPGKTNVVAAPGVKKIAKVDLVDAAGTAVASTFYFDVYEENDGVYGVKVIIVE